MIDYDRLCREPSTAAQEIPTDLIPSIQARVSAALLGLSTCLEAELHRRRMQPGLEPAASGTDRYVSSKDAATMLGVSPSWLHSNAWRLPFAVRLARYGENAPLRFSVEGLQRWRRYLKDELQSGGKTLRSIAGTKDFSLLTPEEKAELQSQPRMSARPRPATLPGPRWDMIRFNEPWRLHKGLRITVEEAAGIMGESADWILKRAQGIGSKNSHGLFFMRRSKHTTSGFDVAYAEFMTWLQYRRSKDFVAIKARELRERWHLK